MIGPDLFSRLGIFESVVLSFHWSNPIERLIDIAAFRSKNERREEEGERKGRGRERGRKEVIRHCYRLKFDLCSFSSCSARPRYIRVVCLVSNTHPSTLRSLSFGIETRRSSEPLVNSTLDLTTGSKRPLTIFQAPKKIQGAL